MDLYQNIEKIINREICDSEETYREFCQRLKQGSLTRDENVLTHFGTFFLPFNSKNKQLFFAHHKKFGLWIAPGGHIDKGEILLDTLNREIWEELGVKNYFKEAPNPFLLTITRINNTTQPCKIHYDIWYLMTTDGGDFNVDPAEFHDTKWLSINEARNLVVNPQNLTAIGAIENLICEKKF